MKLCRTLLVGLVAVGFAFAQETAPAAAAPAAAPAKAEKKAPAAKPIELKGTIVSVDAIGNSIVVKGKKADDTLSVTPETKILSGKKAVALGDLKAESSVTVSYKVEEGKKIATAITEKAAPAPKAEKKAEAAPAAAPAK
jgi:hypothetical protein